MSNVGGQKFFFADGCGCDGGGSGSVGPTGPTGPSSGGTGGGSFEGISVHLASNITGYTGSDPITGWSTSFNSSYYSTADFNLTSGVYTCPVTGKYLINFTCNYTGATNAVQVYRNGVAIYNIYVSAGAPANHNLLSGAVFEFDLNDAITVGLENNCDIVATQYGIPATTLAISLFEAFEGPTGATGPQGPAGTAGTSSFEGFSAGLASNLSAYADDVPLKPWSISSVYYTSANFNLTTGVYTVPEDGYYMVNANIYFPGPDFGYGKIKHNGSDILIGNSNLAVPSNLSCEFFFQTGDQEHSVLRSQVQHRLILTVLC